MKLKFALACFAAAVSASAFAQTYNIDQNHTYPSFETEHFGIRNHTLVPDLEQNLGQIVRKALILDMLDPQSLRGSSRFGCVRQGIVRREDDRLLQMVSAVEERQERTGDRQASEPFNPVRQRIGDALQRAAQGELLLMHEEHFLEGREHSRIVSKRL